VTEMDKQAVRERIAQVGIVPVVRASSQREAQMAAEAVCRGGIPIVEITMTVPGAIEVIRELAKSAGSEVLIGAGTVLNVEAARRCLDAGAQFLVSPGLNIQTVEFAGREGKLIMAGALTPTEVINAWEAGSDFVKVFPCGQVGGAKYIKALKGPLPEVPLVPTGGVNLNTAAEFIEAGAVALGIGGELCHAEALKTGNLEVIIESARKFLAIVTQTRARMKSPVAGGHELVLKASSGESVQAFRSITPVDEASAKFPR
jgi:2-dehydro-3-deoxyphosphogluconate aldolase/(4S)-4-hydroxy-2-oxoglutarate aldolase